MPLLYNKRVLAARIETNPGEAIALANANAGLDIFNAKIVPDVPFEARPAQGAAFSPIRGALGGWAGTATFETELTPRSGSIYPAWAALFLPACGYKATAHVYAPCSEAPGTNVKTLTIGLYEDGMLKVLRGCAGSAVLTFPSGRPVRIAWTFKGIWVPPTDVGILTPTYPSVAPLRFASSQLDIGGWSPRVSQATLDLGNEVTLREDSLDPSGYGYACITGRRITGSMDPESALVDDQDAYGDWLDGAEAALAMNLRTGPGSLDSGIAFDAPALHVTKIVGGERNGLMIESIDFQLDRGTDAGDDELVISFS